MMYWEFWWVLAVRPTDELGKCQTAYCFVHRHSKHSFTVMEVKCKQFWKFLLVSMKQGAQLLQRYCAAGCIIVFAESRRLELGDNILRTLYVYLQLLWYNRPENLSNLVKNRNTFCGTWYLPHSHVHNERTVPIIMAGCMALEREGYISTCGLKSDVTIMFLGLDFL